MRVVHNFCSHLIFTPPFTALVVSATKTGSNRESQMWGNALRACVHGGVVRDLHTHLPFTPSFHTTIHSGVAALGTGSHRESQIGAMQCKHVCVYADCGFFILSSHLLFTHLLFTPPFTALFVSATKTGSNRESQMKGNAVHACVHGGVVRDLHTHSPFTPSVHTSIHCRGCARNGQPQRELGGRHCSANMCASVRCAGSSYITFTPSFHTTIHSTGCVGDQNGQQQREPDEGQCGARMCAWRGSTGSSHPLQPYSFTLHSHCTLCVHTFIHSCNAAPSKAGCAREPQM